MPDKSYWIVDCSYEGFDTDFDVRLENSVGKECSGSGYGGSRDIGWQFFRKDAAMRAGKRLKRFKDVWRVEIFRYVWYKENETHECVETIVLKEE